jgi:hypothetical protein
MRDRQKAIRSNVRNGIYSLEEIRKNHKEINDNTRISNPKEIIRPIPISKEQQFNLKHFGRFDQPEVRPQYITKSTNESPESRRIAESRVTNRESLERFANERAIDKERELKVLPYAASGLVGLATGTLPEMIAGEIAGRAVDYGSEKMTGKS